MSQQKLAHPWPLTSHRPAAVPPLTLSDPILLCWECYMNHLRMKIIFFLLLIGSRKSTSPCTFWDVVSRARVQMQGQICARLLHMLHSSLCNYNGKGFWEDFPLRSKIMWIFYCLTEQDSEISYEPRLLKFTQDKSRVVPVTDCEDNTGLLLDENYFGIMICAIRTSAR